MVNATVVNILVSLVSIFGAGLVGLIIYIWQSLIKKLNHIDSSITEFQITNTKIIQDNIEIKKDMDILFSKDTKRQVEIQSIDKDMHLVKHQLKIT